MEGYVDNLFEQVLDEAYTRHRDNKSDEVLIECTICKEWEGHTDNCPVPVIEKWMARNE